ncbi:MAG TPA: hypothetical protein VKV74_15525 [Bryobacteraceae bacterium]|nr:hypothetical protein [Bryobacteraceae bacterium]
MRLLLALLPAAMAVAQPPVAPTDEPTEPSRGDNASNYNVLQSWELGYRFSAAGGDFDMYRSTVNYTDGVRLLSSSLWIQSRDGHGSWFDQLQFNTLGLGGDPYEFASFRIEKNRLYRYDLTWRSTAYFNPALTLSNGEHLINATNHLQDQDLTLFPQSKVRFFLGYSQATFSGPSLSTIQLFDGSGDEYPIFSNIHTVQNEYRLGGEARLFGFKINALYSWTDFREDTPTNLLAPSPGNNPNDLNTLGSFTRTNPYHGVSPYWRVGLFREGKYWNMNGRFTYVAGRRGFVLNENAFGTSSTGLPTLRQVLTFGDAERPAATGNLNLNFFPHPKVTIATQTSLYNIRMAGDSYFEQYTNSSAISPIYVFNFLGIQTIAASADVQYRWRPWFMIHGGYDFSDRSINSVAAAAVAAPPPGQPAVSQTNKLNAGTLGFRLKAWKDLTIAADGEIGRANKAIYPISERDYQTLTGRVQYRKRAFRLEGRAAADYNVNSVSLASFASRSRQYSVDGSWTPNRSFAVDLAWTKLHLNTLGGISYFVNQLPVNADSYYVSNIQSVSGAIHLMAGKRADLLVGVSHVQDFGDGRSNPLVSPVATNLPSGFIAAQTFPLRFISPMARLSLSLRPRIRWNLGYQYYGYREDFLSLQNYQANTGYSSISWSF